MDFKKLEIESTKDTDYVEFEDDEQIEKPKKKDPVDSLYIRDGKKVMFDDKTMNYYKTLRERHMDPILLSEIDNSISFKYPYEWNPYTGERQGKDPYGPLCFHPDTLIKYYYENRLKNIWVNETEQNGIYYQGYYDVGVGAGPECYIQSRGYNPDKYLLRLPIGDCYGSSSIEDSNVTMGPVLTDDDVKQIDELAKKCGPSYYNNYKRERPNLLEIKKMYDRAINKTPSIMVSPNMTPSQITEAYLKANRAAVDRLKLMKG